MKIEFKNSIRRLSFLCCLLGIKIAWINPCYKLTHQNTSDVFYGPQQNVVLDFNSIICPAINTTDFPMK